MQKLTFGTDGIRGLVGQFPFTPAALQHLSFVIGHWIMERYALSHGRIKVVLAGDTRESFETIKKIITDQLLSFPLDVIDLGVIPTPALVTIMMHDQSFACGIMITASHNPYHDNGIKIFDGVTGKLTLNDEERIGALFDEYAKQEFNVALSDKHGIVTSLPNAQKLYVDALINALPSIRFAPGFKVVLDCAHGATYKVAPALFRALGAVVIVLHDSPNGTNINDQAGALHPQALQEAVVHEGASIGFAFDGDGDRVVMVNAQGEVKDGDDILALLLDLDEYATQKIIVGTVMSNSSLDFFLKGRNKSLIRTPVGDKYIAAMLDDLGLLLGGEPSGHIILKNYLPSGDGILVAIKVLQSLYCSDKWGLDYLVKMPQLTINVPVLRRHDLKEEPYAGILRAYDEKIDRGRILVRYSGTQPLLRIMVEGIDSLITKNIAQQLAQDLLQAFNS